MNFNDSMQRLLRLRRSLERQEEMKLSLASSHLHSAESDLRQARDDSRQRHEARLGDAAQVSGSELQVAELQREVALDREQRMQGEIVALRAAHLQQCQVLLGRTRERKTLDTLRQHHIEAQRRDELRREQASLDESFLQRKPPAD